MKASKIDKFLFWMLMGVILLVFVVLFLATVKPAGAKSVCGAMVGPAAVVEDALVLANVPHYVIEKHTAPIASCQAIGCPKPRPTTCLGWNIHITATPTRWLELAFGKTGVFYGVK